ncbi:hypothetical protein OIU84_013504 [Salix udensis]|uniref:Uncharacterized protein n=1 Tax=Salix udensis TaxID=889485 RepID=A0AAD6NU52_9ROSI|nr:hypothetical protein OIU84_013504 [Salix udensis]
MMCQSGGGGGAIMVLCRLVMKKALMCFASNTDQLFDHFCNFNNFDFFGGMERGLDDTRHSCSILNVSALVLNDNERHGNLKVQQIIELHESAVAIMQKIMRMMPRKVEIS